MISTVIISLITSLITATILTVVFRSKIRGLQKQINELTIWEKGTRLYKRNHFDDLYIKEFHRARRTSEVLSIIYLKVEENDKTALNLTNSIKRNTDYICHYGKNLYLLLLTGTNADGTEHVIDRLTDTFSDQSHHMGIYSGIPDSHTSSQSMLDEAMKALEKSISSRNRIEFSLNSI